MHRRTLLLIAAGLTTTVSPVLAHPDHADADAETAMARVVVDYHRLLAASDPAALCRCKESIW